MPVRRTQFIAPVGAVSDRAHQYIGAPAASLILSYADAETVGVGLRVGVGVGWCLSCRRVPPL